MRGAGLDDAFAMVAAIVADVRERGDAALLDWAERFDGPRRTGRVPASGSGGAVDDDVLEARAR